MTGEDVRQANALRDAVLTIRTLKQRLAAAEAGAPEPIAIVGMSCRFPGAPSAAEFWRLLEQRGSGIGEVPASRWAIDEFYSPDVEAPGKMYVRRMGSLGDIERFDASLFGVAPREAERLDPQQRLLLEVAWEALEDAAIPLRSLRDSATSVFVGLSASDYFELAGDIDAYWATGSAASTAAGRISYTLGLRGPSMSIDTACSSSLVALHLACQSLSRGESEASLVGGVNLILRPQASIGFSKMRALSPDGSCKAFDASANGYVRGEGCGMLVLEPLSRALRERRKILAVIRGSAVNQDGRSNGLTAPNGPAQQAVIRAALARANVSAADVQYVEAHGTGTPLGDPIEIQALDAVYGGAGRTQPLWVGSVKTNVGHLEPAAGLASVMKVVLALQRERIPPQLHFERPNPNVAWSEVAVSVLTEERRWPRGGQARLAGVSSFGFSGTNAHVILEEGPAASPSEVRATPHVLLPLSAKTSSALGRLCRAMASHLQSHPEQSLSDVCYTAGRGRSPLEVRRAFAGASRVELHERLLAAALAPASPRSGITRLAFVFGAGPSVSPALHRELGQSNPVYAAALAQADAWVAELRPDWRRPSHELAEPSGALAPERLALFVHQYALSELWRSWGVAPRLVLGVGIGEHAAACVAGLTSFRSAVEAVCRALDELPASADGPLALAVAAGQHDVASWLDRRARVVASLGPRRCIVHAEASAHAGVVASLQARGVRCASLGVDLCAGTLGLRPGAFEPPRCDWLSAAGRRLQRGEPLALGIAGAEGDRFLDLPWLVRELQSGRIDGLLEVGPRSSLLAELVDGWGEEAAPRCLPGLGEGSQASAQLLRNAAALYEAGLELDFGAIHGGERVPIQLPTYPFERVRFWHPEASPSRTEPTGHPLLTSRSAIASIGELFEGRIDPRGATAYLWDHRVRGQAVLPLAAAIEMALAAGRLHFGGRDAALSELALHTPIALHDAHATRLQILIAPEGPNLGRFTIHSRTASSATDGWTSHAAGSVTVADAASRENSTPGDRIAGLTSRDSAGCYAALSQLGLDYGPAFRALQQAWFGEGIGVAKLALTGGASGARHGIHPALLDAAFQLAALVNGARGLPFALSSCRVFERELSTAWAVARVQSEGNVRSADVRLYDDAGTECARFQALRSRALDAPEAGSTRRHEREVFLPAWAVRARAGARRAVAASWTIVAEPRDAAAEWLEQRLRSHDFAVRACASVAELAALPASASEGREHVVAFWSSAAADAGDGARQQVLRAIEQVRALSSRSGGSQRLSWITRATQPVLPLEPVDVQAAPLWGLGRVVQKEHPELDCNLIDLGRRDEAELEALWGELTEPAEENQVALRGALRYVPDVVREARPLAGATPLAPALDAPPRAGSVLVTGGLGAVGLELARWLVTELGVDDLVLAGRSAPGAEQSARLRELEAQGARVEVVALDVTDRGALSALLATLEGPRRLRGVVHAAGLLDDGMLHSQPLERVASVLGPKVVGAWNLHAATSTCELEFFVLISSISSLLGPVGQAAYAAANAFLDALAHERRRLGLAAHSVNYGPWKGLGMAGHSGALASRAGIASLEPAEALELLGIALRSPEAQLGLFRLQGPGLGPFAPERLLSSRNQVAFAATDSAVASELGATLARLAAPKRRAAVEQWVAAEVAKVLSLPGAASVSRTQPLRDLGLDSMMAVDLRDRLASHVGKSLSATLAFDYPSVDALAGYVLGEFEGLETQGPLEAEAAWAGDDVAIVGIGCHYPGAVDDEQSFWSLLEREVDAIVKVPARRWDADAIYDPSPDAAGKSYTREGGFLPRVDEFDAEFFGISRREAIKMDPQQRLLLETAWEALEAAGIAPGSVVGSETGVFMGLMTQEYIQFSGHSLAGLDGHVATGTLGSVVSGRISYALGLKGPSLTVDTACSSSLVAVHLACRSLRSGECNLALAGGVTLILTPTLHVEFSRLRAQSADARCKSFAAAADGTGWGEGAGVVVLKRLRDALRDDDRILAVIRGSAVNQDGRSSGLTSPNGPSQERVIRRALLDARVTPRDIDFVEAHGTGTALGDPIEMQALGAVMRDGHDAAHPVWVGALKSNIGHTQAAAGVGGLIKAALALSHERLPANLHFDAPSPHIPWPSLPVEVLTRARAWPRNGRRRLAGVSAFGLSGTNAHVVLEEAPERDALPAPAEPRSHHLLVVSAKTPGALARLTQRYADYASGYDGELRDLCHTAAERRTHFEQRRAVVGQTAAELARELREAGAMGSSPAGERPGKLCLLYTGQGSQYAGMGRALFETSRTYRQAIERCDAAFRAETGSSLIDLCFADEASDRIHDTEYAQPLLFSVGWALSELWRSAGVEPDLLLGHSLGEYIAAAVAGVMSVEDGVRLVTRRGRSMRELCARGAMLGVGCSEGRLRELLGNELCGSSLAAYNGPAQLVLSGDAERIEHARARLIEAGVHVRPLRVSQAFHSALMEPMLEPFARAVSELQLRAPERGLISNLSGELAGVEVAGSAYWVRHVREPVRFQQGLETAWRNGARTFLELGPHPTLIVAGKPWLDADEAGLWLHSLRRGEPDWKQVQLAAAGLYASGRDLVWDELLGGRGRVVSLPTYGWDRQSYWAEGRELRDEAPATGQHALIGRRLNLASSQQVYESRWSRARLAELVSSPDDAALELGPLALLELARAAGQAHFGNERLELGPARLAAVALPAEGELTLQTLLEPSEGGAALRISRLERDATGERWVELVRTQLRRSEDSVRVEDIAALERRLRAASAAAPAPLGVESGTGSWSLATEQEVLTHVERSPSSSPEALDACWLQPPLWHAVARAGALLAERRAGAPVAWRGVGRARWLERPGTADLWVHARTTGAAADAPIEWRVLDAHGVEVCTLEQVDYARGAAIAATGVGVDRDSFESVWLEAAPSAPARRIEGERWLLLCDRRGLGERLAQQLRAAGAEPVQVFAAGPELASSRALDPLDPGAFVELLRELGGGLRGVVYLWALDAGADLDAARAWSYAGALHLAQALAGAASSGEPPRLWFATRGARSVDAGDADPLQAALTGVTRTLCVEQPEYRPCHVDLDPASSDGAELLFAELAHGDDETHVAYRGGVRKVERLKERELPPAGGVELRRDACYLVTGGSGALGLATARWLVAGGAGEVVLVSRSGPSPELDERLAPLRASATRVVVRALDVADAAAVHALVSELAGAALPLRGVLHAAGTLDDGVLSHQSWQRYLGVWRPKAEGAWNLHRATLDVPLDFFVLYSSIVSLLGSPGQLNYAASNAFLDALAHRRRREGLAALSVNWGAWSGGGFAARQSELSRRRRQLRGLDDINEARGMRALERALASHQAQVAIMPIRPSLLVEQFGFGAETPPLFRAILARGDGSRADAGALFAQLPPQLRRQRCLDQIKSMTRRVLGMSDGAPLSTTRPLSELGADSLIAVELRNRIGRAFGVRLASTVVFDHPTLEALTDHVLGELVSMPEPVQPAPAQEAGVGPIAVVGMACRFPGGARDPESFWTFLEHGGLALGDVPAGRWDTDRFFDPERRTPGSMYTRTIGSVADVDQFDPEFFQISPLEAEGMDPQQRFLLELTWEALEDAGVAPPSLVGSATGFFVGVCTDDYRPLAALNGTPLGGLRSPAAGRVSYALGLEGPSLVVDTACSSSLVAVHLACKSLRDGESELAVAGGVSLILSPVGMVAGCQLGALSPTGGCKTFDAAADGYTRGEGCGLVVLKRLADALAAHDRIYAVILGSAVNQDGRSNGLTAPSGPAQERLIREALRRSDVPASAVGYVETHGTGTRLGDPIEVSALSRVLSAERNLDQPLVLGAVKANIGHLEAAAGVAGLIKAVLSVHRGVIPPQPRFETPNPEIDWERAKALVPTRPTAWAPAESRRIAGVSSFGVSGTNSHVVIANHVPAAAPDAPDEAAAVGPALLLLSAKNERSLRQLARRYSDFLARGASALADVCHSARRRTRHELSLALVARDSEQMARSLAQLGEGDAAPGSVQGRCLPPERLRIGFVYPGHGSQWRGMARVLLGAEPVFRRSIEECDRAFREFADWSLLDELRSDDGRLSAGHNEVVQPALFAISTALTALWESHGVVPDAVVGHSMGEVAAVHAAGALDLRDAARIICRRSQIVGKTLGRGSMLLVELGASAARELILAAGVEAEVAIAVSNSRRFTVLSGARAALSRLVERLVARSVFNRWVNVDYASHSPQMDELRDELLGALSGLAPTRGRVPIYSTARDSIVWGEECDPDYWFENLRNPVAFGSAVQRMSADGVGVFLELSPHPLLVPSIQEGLRDAGAEGAVVPSLRRDEDDLDVLKEALGALYVAGIDLDVQRHFPGKLVSLPGYAWDHDRYWVEAADPSLELGGAAAMEMAAPALSDEPAADEAVETSALGVELPELAHLPETRIWHAEQGSPPAAWCELWSRPLPYRRMVAAAANVARAHGFEPGLLRVELDAAGRSLSSAGPLELQTVAARRDVGLDVLVHFRTGPSEPWRLFGRAEMQPAVPGRPRDARAATGHRGRVLPRWELAARLRQCGFDDTVTDLDEVECGTHHVTARVRLPEPTSGARLPRLVSVVSRLWSVAVTLEASVAESLELDAAECIELHAPLEERVQVSIVRSDEGVDVHVTGAGAHLECSLRRCSFRAAQPSLENLAQRLYEVVWSAPDADAPAPRATGSWLVLGEGDALVQKLRARGQRCEHIELAATNEPGASDELARRLGRGDVTGVVLAAAQPAFEFGCGEPAELPPYRARCLELLRVVGELQRAESGRARLWVVTRGGEPTGDVAGGLALGHAPLLGLSRAVALECPGVWGGSIDLDGPLDERRAEQAVQTLLAPGGEDQFAWRDGRVLVPRLSARHAEPPVAGFALRSDRSYLVTGGLGGIGREVVRWLVARGARHLVLTARHAPKPESAESRFLASLAELGAQVAIAPVDVSDRASMRALIEGLDVALGGVFHAAGTASVAAVGEIGAENLAAVCRPKVEGAWVLHELTAALPLDHWVMFSSIASVWGAGREGHYCAANAFLDAIVRFRRGAGLPAACVNWGYWATPDGMGGEAGDAFVRSIGTEPLPSALSMLALEQLLAAGHERGVVAWMRWEHFVSVYNARRERRLFRRLTAAPAAGGTAPARSPAEELSALAPDALHETLRRLVKHEVSALLRLRAGRELGDHQGFSDAGMDSILAVQIARRLQERTGVEIKTVTLFEHPTASRLAAYIGAAFEVAGEPGSSPEQAGEEFWEERLDALLAVSK